ncbi:TetR/AcrR family transcriptional regulator [Burkholderia catarinensis]|uniref:TetR/AcrR family transcriptional regulator n=1 Tax=Burkholderia catarinensis TaxID=1108140 RepID=UPI0009228330|nr:TetR/AcrR family transcriptional regulator [Burkholderia catarinensis]KAG8149041.1 TetR family transcriptional regulator [Burkholderia catarinensis]
MTRVRAALRRQDFVDAAVEVIAAHGVAGATTRRIAQAAGCPLASLHYVFHTKDDLFDAVYESLFDLLATNVPADSTFQSFGEFAGWQLRKMVEWLVENPSYARAQSELIQWAARHRPDFALRTYVQTVERTIAYFGKCAPQVSNDMIEPVARMSLILIDGLLSSWLAEPNTRRLRANLNSASSALEAFATAISNAAIQA